MTILEYLWLPWVRSLWISLSVIILFLIIRKWVVKLALNIFKKLTSKTKSEIDDKLIQVLRKPARMLLTFSVFFIAYKTLNLEGVLQASTLDTMDAIALKIYRTVIIIAVFNVFYQMTTGSHVFFKEFFAVFDIRVDPLLVPFVSKVLRLLIFFIGIAIVCAEWGFDVNGFVAGLGLGGLAFALAAQDTLSNTFGGAVILTEKPFTIGDWILVNEVEGTVEDISFRSTRVRKFDKSIVTVPNSTIAKANVINYSQRNIRRISYDLKIKFKTPLSNMKTIVESIRSMLYDHEGIHNETIFVHFNSLGESSYNIFLYYFTNTSVWSEYLALTEDTNFKILEILEANDVELAVPIQAVILDKQEESQVE
jgi:MscS family membrane protein